MKYQGDIPWNTKTTLIYAKYIRIRESQVKTFLRLAVEEMEAIEIPIITTPSLCRDLLQIISITFVIGYDLEICVEKIIVETYYTNL